jgi:hypothetical protein
MQDTVKYTPATSADDWTESEQDMGEKFNYRSVPHVPPAEL